MREGEEEMLPIQHDVYRNSSDSVVDIVNSPSGQPNPQTTSTIDVDESSVRSSSMSTSERPSIVGQQGETRDGPFRYYTLIHDIHIRVHEKTGELQMRGVKNDDKEEADAVEENWSWETVVPLFEEKEQVISSPGIWRVMKDVFTVLASLFALVVFVVLAVLPLWKLESDYEKQATNKNEISKWTYGNTIYFAIASLCSVGYGDFVPDTPGAKVYVCFFLMVGMPLSAMWFTIVGTKYIGNVGKLLVLYIQAIDEGVFWMLTKVFPRKFQAEQIFFIASYAVIGAAIFKWLEDWSFGIAAYFTIVSLTTLGYGDVTVKTTGGRIFLCFFLILGVGMLAVLIGLIGQAYVWGVTYRVKEVKKHGKKVITIIQRSRRRTADKVEED